MSPTALIYRSELLHPSETFIDAQAHALRRGQHTARERTSSSVHRRRRDKTRTLRDTPQAVIDLLHGELAKALALPETRKRLLELGFDPAGGTPAELTRFEKQERAKWGPIIKATGLQGG